MEELFGCIREYTAVEGSAAHRFILRQFTRLRDGREHAGGIMEIGFGFRRTPCSAPYDPRDNVLKDNVP
jgi:hypothetical protein